MKRLDDQDITLANWRADHGLCSVCGEPALPGQSLCAKCAGVESPPASRSTARSATAAALRSARTRAKRAAAEGVCIRCGRRPPADGHVLCTHCLLSMTNGNIKRRFAAHVAAVVGVCTVCQRRQARPGHLTCGECAEAAATRRKELRAKRAEAGLCTECGAPLGDDHRGRQCAKCAARKAKTVTEWRKRKQKRDD